MEEFCKNCGAKIKEDNNFCPECGTKIETAQPQEINFCENCGNELNPGEEFCSQCGTNIHNPQPVNNSESKGKNFIEENKIPIAIVGVVGLIVLVLLLASSVPQTTDHYNTDVGTQNVEVDTINFEIPANFRLIPSSIDYDYANYVSSYSHTYTNGEDNITLMVMYSPGVYVDAQQINDQTGGIKKTICGYDGYYNEYSDGYSFTFAKDNKLCIIVATSPYLFDEINVLG